MLSGKKFSHGLEMLPDPCSPELMLEGSLTDVPTDLEGMAYLPENSDTGETGRQQTSGKKDLQLIQYRGNPLLSLLEDAPPRKAACKMESANDVLLASLEDGPPSPLSSDANGEYKLFPLLLLSPIANFLEEASEIKPPEPERGLPETTASQL
ncbi:UNVERIFIED_CONTAM: hypothetical protein K2H54_057735 [Gekko kuhli]